MPVIELVDVCQQFHSQPTLDNVSFSVERGKIFGIVGPNGSGKTLLLECIAGRLAPDQGSVSVLGLNPARDQEALRRRIAVRMPVSALPSALSAWDALDLYSCFHGQPADWRPVLEQLGLADASQCRPRPLTTGQRQRLTMVLALAGQPEIVLLDDFATGLDPQARRDVGQLIEQVRARGTTILLTSHHFEEAARICDRVAVINAGQLTISNQRDLTTWIPAIGPGLTGNTLGHTSSRTRTVINAY